MKANGKKRNKTEVNQTKNEETKTNEEKRTTKETKMKTKDTVQLINNRLKKWASRKQCIGKFRISVLFR